MKLVAYVRVSTDAQVEGYGLGVQRDAIRKWAKDNGHKIVRWTADEGVSGANGLEQRDGLTEALEALQRDQSGRRVADGVVIYGLDRLARLLHVQEAVLGQVWAADARVFSVIDGGEVLQDDPDDPVRTAMRQMRGVFSQLDRAMIAKRLRDGRARKAAEGGYATGAPPYGWKAEGGELVEVDEEQAVIASIRKWHRAGVPMAEIARRLNDRGTPTRYGRAKPGAETVRGGRWHPTTVARVLARG